MRIRLPLKPLTCTAKLTPLPVHVSWRNDPGSGVPLALVEAVLAYPSPPAPGKASKKSMTT